jgi:ATP-binding cassette subfamily F protein uup
VDGKSILKGISFRLNTTERLALFGENGAGKSTLLKILVGEYEADEGEIYKEGHVRFVYVAQEFSKKNFEKTIYEYILENAGIQYLNKVFKTGQELGYDLEKNQNKKCSELSGGQQKILAISSALVLSPDYLLLDEPENHLDIVSRMTLMEMLQNFRGGIIFISHDRLLIENVSTKVGEIFDGVMHLSEGGYEDYLEAKRLRIGGLQREYDEEEKRLTQLRKSLIILKQKAHRGKDVSQYRSRLAEFEELKKSHNENSRPSDEKTKIKIGLAKDGLHGGKLLFRMNKVSFSYEKKKIFSRASLEFRSGKKVVLLGRNGSGKSTFLKCMLGELSVTEGDVFRADEIKVTYFDQHANFDENKTAAQVVGEMLNITDIDAKAALGAMKFDSDRMKIPTKNLSGGEKMRIRFALAFTPKPDLLILDEPTNHIDEITWEILLDACKSFKNSILLVTHDHEFIEEFNPNFFWKMENGTVSERHKNLDELLEEMKEG